MGAFPLLIDRDETQPAAQRRAGSVCYRSAPPYWPTPDPLMPSLRVTLRSLLMTSLCLLAIDASAAGAGYGDLHWRLLGPFRGGRVLTVAGVPG